MLTNITAAITMYACPDDNGSSGTSARLPMTYEQIGAAAADEAK